MKTFQLIFALLLSVICSEAQPFTIDGRTFHPAFTNSSNAGYLKEYLLTGQTLENWTNLFAVRCFKDLDSPKDYIARMQYEYRVKYPNMKCATGGQESRNRWFIDFLAYPKEKSESKFLEWDFFRAEVNSSGGILVFQYAERRAYKKSIKEFDKWDIKGLRQHMLPLLTTNEFTIR
jgi:hypothetical protein